MVGKRIKCMYHQIKENVPCPDGISSAWVVVQKYPDAQLIGCVHQETIPEISDGDTIIIVDFSFPLDVLKNWEDRGCKLILIDHHKSLIDNLHKAAKANITLLLEDYLNFPDPFYMSDSKLFNSFLQFTRFTDFHRQPKQGIRDKLGEYIDKYLKAISIKELSTLLSKADIHFDLKKCGAVLTWEYFFPEESIPEFLYYVQDRDLWQWKLPKSREINAAFSYIGRQFKDMDAWAKLNKEELEYYFYDLGNMVYSPRKQRAEKIAKKAEWVSGWGYRFLAIELSELDAPFYNDVLEHLYTNNLDSIFVCSYIKRSDNTYKISLRSKQAEDSFDCTKIANGHHNAAGLILDTLPWKSVIM